MVCTVYRYIITAVHQLYLEPVSCDVTLPGDGVTSS